MRLAVLGGTFNPPHIGHLILAEEVRRAAGYDRILFIPANIPPHKDTGTAASAPDRLAMVRKAIAGERDLEVSDLEIRRGGLSYTVDTIEHLIASRTDIAGKPGFIIGDDLIATLPSWHRIDELARMADLIVVSREETIADARRTMPYPALFCVMPKIDISSTMLRERFAGGEECRYLVPEAVRKYIKKKKLYRR